jgi:hypothetical protein
MTQWTWESWAGCPEAGFGALQCSDGCFSWLLGMAMLSGSRCRDIFNSRRPLSEHSAWQNAREGLLPSASHFISGPQPRQAARPIRQLCRVNSICPLHKCLLMAVASYSFAVPTELGHGFRGVRLAGLPRISVIPACTGENGERSLGSRAGADAGLDSRIPAHAALPEPAKGSSCG